MVDRDRTRSRIVSRLTSCQHLEGLLLDEAEAARLHQRLGGLAELVLRPDQPAEPPDPRDPLVALVPDQGQLAAGTEHASDLGQGHVEVEPVEGLRRDHDVDDAVAQRELLGAGDGGRGTPGTRSREDLEHRLVGVGGVHVVAEGDQLGGELAGAGAELENARRARDRPARPPPRGVARPAAVVGVGHRPEGPRPPGGHVAGPVTGLLRVLVHQGQATSGHGPDRGAT